MSCALVVFLAITSLTISVATRYCSPQNASYSARTLHKHSSPEQVRQRLTKSATNWMPQFMQSGVLPASAEHSSIFIAGPTVSTFFLEASLYNRPPPSC